MDKPQPGRVQQVMGIILTLGMIWFMLPEHQRRLILMRITHGAQRAAGRAARREGHAGMGDELAGQAGQAERRYSAAYSFSRARDAFGRALESLRP